MLTYPLDLPRAAPDDLSQAFREQDPLPGVNERLAELKAIRSWVDGEEAKWHRVVAAVEAFGAPQAEVPSGLGGSPAVGSNGAMQAPATRRERVIAILGSRPGQAWRTGEVGAELERRGWSTGSTHELGKVSKILADLVSEGIAERVDKGLYKRVSVEAGVP